jgi:hypothetical protein
VRDARRVQRRQAKSAGYRRDPKRNRKSYGPATCNDRDGGSDHHQCCGGPPPRFAIGREIKSDTGAEGHR